MSIRVTVDPVTRVEGHLRLDCQVDEGKVTRAWSSGQMWRGIEKIVLDRDPRDAWIFAQRICGVCTTVHAMASVRAVEDALGLAIPLNAQYIRNVIIAAHAVHDYMVHFYHLSALDWFDIVSALDGDPREAAEAGEAITPCVSNSASYMRAVKRRLKDFVESGQLGIFSNGYWGHPEYKLPPELNLLLASHYLFGLDVQRKANQIVTILGGKTPHIQNLAVGGVANAINLSNQSTLTLDRLMFIGGIIDEIGDFICSAHLGDVAALCAHYPEWTRYGIGLTSYLSVPDLPMDPTGSQMALPGGYVRSETGLDFQPINGFKDPFFRDGVQESVKHAWYAGEDTRHPWDGETTPSYTGFQDDGKYSWVKAPTFYDEAVEVGPTASVLAMLAAGHERTRYYFDQVNARIRQLGGTELTVSDLQSTLGRHVARGIRSAVLYDALKQQWKALVDNVGKNDQTTYNPPSFPKGEIRGVGFHEAPRGVLSHWIVIRDGKIHNYQAVVPSTWNSAPRNQNEEMAPYEASLIGIPLADPQRPLEPLRVVRSFDPCMACAVHLQDLDSGERIKVRAL
jgi:hydrogenase large subunit